MPLGTDSRPRLVATERSVWLWPGVAPADLPGWHAVELTVGDATLGFTPAEVRDLVEDVLHGA